MKTKTKAGRQSAAFTPLDASDAIGNKYWEIIPLPVCSSPWLYEHYELTDLLIYGNTLLFP